MKNPFDCETWHLLVFSQPVWLHLHTCVITNDIIDNLCRFGEITESIGMEMGKGDFTYAAGE